MRVRARSCLAVVACGCAGQFPLIVCPSCRGSARGIIGLVPGHAEACGVYSGIAADVAGGARGGLIGPGGVGSAGRTPSGCVCPTHIRQCCAQSPRSLSSGCTEALRVYGKRFPRTPVSPRVESQSSMSNCLCRRMDFRWILYGYALRNVYSCSDL